MNFPEVSGVYSADHGPYITDGHSSWLWLLAVNGCTTRFIEVRLSNLLVVLQTVNDPVHLGSYYEDEGKS
jgi:hypothetical protein